MKKDAKHSFIHDVRIAKPCPANWNTMTGDERTRFCHQCKLHVYNISEMTTDEAENLIIENEGKLCVRIYRRADGTVLTKDCPKGLAAFRKRLVTMYGAALGIAAAVVGWKVNAVERGHIAGEMQVRAVQTTGALAAPATKDLGYASGGVSVALPEGKSFVVPNR